MRRRETNNRLTSRTLTSSTQLLQSSSREHCCTTEIPLYTLPFPCPVPLPPSSSPPRHSTPRLSHSHPPPAVWQRPTQSSTALHRQLELLPAPCEGDDATVRLSISSKGCPSNPNPCSHTARLYTELQDGCNPRSSSRDAGARSAVLTLFSSSSFFFPAFVRPASRPSAVSPVQEPHISSLRRSEGSWRVLEA